MSASFFGFSVLAFQLRHIPKSPFPEYITYYPAVLVAQSALVFSVSSNGNNFQASYSGGTGNDLTLTVGLSLYGGAVVLRNLETPYLEKA